jgi:hypothetical protein
VLARPITWNLDRLGWLYRADKGPGGHGYTAHYRHHLAERRRRPLKVLKIGVYKGASLQMWRSYFPRSRILGIDITPIELDDSRIATFAGHQEDAAFLEEVLDKTGPDLVIDDGSHLGPHIIASFRVLFPRLAPGGIYVFEDLHTAYSADFQGGPPGTPRTSIALVKDLVDAVNAAGFQHHRTAPMSPVATFHPYGRIAFIERR